MKTPFGYLILGFIIALAGYVILHGIPQASSSSAALQKLQDAEAQYSLGEHAKTVAERKEAFNKALKDYLFLEKVFDPIYGNGKLYYNLGNVNFQLEEYPLAAYYYYKALSLMPRNNDVKDNLSMALHNLNLPSQQNPSVFRKVFFFHTFFSLPERLRLFFLFSLACIVTLSLFIWLRKQWLQFPIALLGAISLLFLGSLLYARYLEPIEGVLVHAAVLHRDAGSQYALISDKPLSAGLKVQVLDLRENGAWLKVLSPEGNIGFLKQSEIRLI